MQARNWAEITALIGLGWSSLKDFGMTGQPMEDHPIRQDFIQENQIRSNVTLSTTREVANQFVIPKGKRERLAGFQNPDDLLQPLNGLAVSFMAIIVLPKRAGESDGGHR